MIVAMMGINDWGEHMPCELASNSRGVFFLKYSRVYKLARLLWLHILNKAKESGFYNSGQARHPPGGLQVYLPRIVLKEAYAQPPLAEDKLKQIIELNPQDDQAYLRLGCFYRDQGRPSEAESAFKKAIELNPKNDEL